jgi:hypothetical protein
MARRYDERTDALLARHTLRVPEVGPEGVGEVSESGDGE